MPTTPDEKLIPPELTGQALDALVRAIFSLSWGKAREWIETGKVTVNGVTTVDGRSIPLAGARLRLDMNAPRLGRDGIRSARPAISTLSSDRIVFCDSHLVVVNKPSGISTVPFDQNERGTLQDLVCEHLKQRSIEVVHRIDKETSGLVVFARNREAAAGLANQFRFHTVRRRYLALAHGRVESSTIRSTLIENRGDGLRGTVRAGWRVARGEGQEAITHVRALEYFTDATWVECRLETGRTHQIRIHLSEAGNPLLGEKLYIRDYSGVLKSASRVMLHATELGFSHPDSGAPLFWECDAPEDFQGALRGLRV